MPVATLGRWGNSLAVRIPGDAAAAAHLVEGDVVEIEARDDALIIRKAAPRFTLAEMFEGRYAAAWRADYAGAFDWGENVGREAVPDLAAEVIEGLCAAREGFDLDGFRSGHGT